MFGIILGTLCLIALIATIRRERYFQRHGYPQYRRGHHHGCGPCYGGYGPQPDATAPRERSAGHGAPDAPPGPTPAQPAPDGGAS